MENTNTNFSRQQKRNLLTVLSFIGVVTLMIVNAYKMSILHDLEEEGFMSQSLVSDKAQRLPDVIIVGVKKSGTITLAKFLDYHPSIAAVGEIQFFEHDEYYKMGL